MSSPVVVQVHPLSEVRARLSGILARFRREGATAEPVAFGSHRKPEAVLIPYEAYERHEALARQRARLDGALSAAQSVQVERRTGERRAGDTHAALIFLKESPVLASYDLRHLRATHRRSLGDIYAWAGQLRTVAIAKGTWSCLPQYIESAAAKLFRALHGESLLRGLVIPAH